MFHVVVSFIVWSKSCVIEAVPRELMSGMLGAVITSSYCFRLSSCLSCWVVLVSTGFPRGDHGWRFTARCKSVVWKIEKSEMLSNDVFVWAGYDITQTRYIKDCIGARVVSNDLLSTEICRRNGRPHDAKNHKIFEKFGKISKMSENEWELRKLN